MKSYAQLINEHYTQSDLGSKILNALERLGKGGQYLELDDLAGVSEFHIRGRKATRDLAQLAELQEGAKILDLGAGIGGPARTLASEYGCEVMGIELTEEFCRTANLLNERTRLEKQVHIQQGDMTAMPFEANLFDFVWSQHVEMNIPNKTQLYREILRVLKPNGRFALYEICAGQGGQVHFPVPWASDNTINFLVPPEEMKRMLEQAGFKPVSWHDDSSAALAWFRELAANAKARPADAPPPVGLNLIMGNTFPQKFQNLGRNLEEDRIRVIQAIFDRA